jgi:hypothetical protein
MKKEGAATKAVNTNQVNTMQKLSNEGLSMKTPLGDGVVNTVNIFDRGNTNTVVSGANSNRAGMPLNLFYPT